MCGDFRERIDRPRAHLSETSPLGKQLYVLICGIELRLSFDACLTWLLEPGVRQRTASSTKSSPNEPVATIPSVVMDV